MENLTIYSDFLRKMKNSFGVRRIQITMQEIPVSGTNLNLRKKRDSKFYDPKIVSMSVTSRVYDSFLSYLEQSNNKIIRNLKIMALEGLLEESTREDFSYKIFGIFIKVNEFAKEAAQDTCYNLSFNNLTSYNVKTQPVLAGLSYKVKLYDAVDTNSLPF